MRTDDITTLFLFLRQRSRGRETVREVGDFIAHRDERTKKSIVTDAVRDFVTILRFQMPRLEKPVDSRNLPMNFMEILWATLRRLDDATLNRSMGVKRKAAEKSILPKIEARLQPNGHGGLALTWLDTPEEIAVFEQLPSFIIAKPAFTEERLIKEFVDALHDEGLIDAEESKVIHSFKSVISLTAVIQMHLSQVDLGDGTKAEICACVGYEGHICSLMSAEVFNSMNQKAAGYLYSTTLKAEDYCEQSLLAEQSRSIWTFALELSPAGKLVRLGR